MIGPMKKTQLNLSLFFSLILSLVISAPSYSAESSFADLLNQYGLPTHTATKTYQGQYGPYQIYNATSTDSESTLKPLGQNIRIGTYNILNLFEHLQNDQNNPVKNHERRLGNAAAILEMNADFQLLVEVENLAALQTFNKDYLNDDYVPFLVDGNDTRGIDVALLVKKNLRIEVEYRSHKNYGGKVFSRDAPVALIFDLDSHGKRLNQPKLAIMLEHKKSKRSDPGKEDQTAATRRAQAIASVEIVELIKAEFSGNFPIIVGGDFNTAIHSSSEIHPYFDYGFKDSLDLITNPIARELRDTHFYFSPEGKLNAEQIDVLLVLGDTCKVTDAQIYPTRDKDGNALPAPRSFAEREERPSDHLPIGIEINL